jgi:outer membrane murein-binding lipoprotein Lpp
MRRAALIAAAAIGTLLTACGSSRLSHADFVAKANAICSDYNAQVRRLRRPQSVSEIETYALRVLALYRAALERLEALRPPKADEATAIAWLARDRKVEADVERLAAAARTRRIPAVQAARDRAAADNERSDRLANSLGLRECTRG